MFCFTILAAALLLIGFYEWCGGLTQPPPSGLAARFCKTSCQAGRRLHPLPDPSTYGPNAENSVRKADDGLFSGKFFAAFQKVKKRMTYVLATPMTGSRRGLFVPLKTYE